MQDHVIERISNHNESNHSNNRIDLDDIREHERVHSNSKNSNNNNNRMSNHSLKNLQSSSKKDNYKATNSNDG
jgi:hypothetical protein